ncbi:MAG TPA: nuclear transport factor 2 family protein [Terracidiphilus sp.]|nr:nuclear transport factor 2 family protein [Terracidiphilus sp.]
MRSGDTIRYAMWEPGANAPAVRRNRSLIAVLMIVIACQGAVALGMPRAERHESHEEIDQLEEIWRSAILERDARAMDSLLSDDYLAITARGTLMSREQTLAGLRNGAIRFTSLKISDRKVRFYGTTAVVTSRADVNGVTPLGAVVGAYRYTRVYVRNNAGAWKIVSFEASRVTGHARNNRAVSQDH